MYEVYHNHKKYDAANDKIQYLINKITNVIQMSKKITQKSFIASSMRLACKALFFQSFTYTKANHPST